MSNGLHSDRWLSTILQRDCYKLQLDDAYLNDQSGQADLGRQLCNSRSFLYAKVSAHDVRQVSFLEERGFRLVDTNVVFAKKISKSSKAHTATTNGYEVRRALPSDQDNTVSVGERSFRYSRFHLDPQIPNELARKVKAEWVRNYFKGERGDAMIVAAHQGQIAGFLLLLCPPERLVIDLIATDEAHRRKGLARAMIEYAEAQFQHLGEMHVGTQLANLPSMNFYEEMGFRLFSSQYVFHFHGDE